MAEETVNVTLVTLTLLLTCYPLAQTHEGFRKCFHFYLNWVAANWTVRIQSISVPLFFLYARTHDFTHVGATVLFPKLVYHIQLSVRQYTGRDGALTLSHLDLYPYRKRQIHTQPFSDYCSWIHNSWHLTPLKPLALVAE